MVTRNEWYERVNASWPETIPVPTHWQAVNAVRRLWRWGMNDVWRGPVRVVSGKRYTWERRGTLLVNPNRPGSEGGGWKALIHDLSHLMWRKANPEGVRPHEKGHAKLELRMIEEVLKRGWLSSEPAPDQKEAPKPTKRDVQSKRYDRIKARIEAWEAKERRVKNAIKKLRLQASYYERQLAS